MAQESGVRNVKSTKKVGGPVRDPNVPTRTTRTGGSGTFGPGGSKSTGGGGHTSMPRVGAPRTPAGPSGGYSGGGGGGGGGGALDALGGSGGTDQDYLAGDSSYQAQLAALAKALSDYDTDVGAQRTKYDVDYNDSLKGLGWSKEVPDDPATAGVDESMPGAWNMQDQNTASGRAFSNQQNDFASRGLLQSSLFGTANDNLSRSLNDQLGSINTGRQSFLDDLMRQQAAFQSENTLSAQQARAEALARRAAGISL